MPRRHVHSAVQQVSRPFMCHPQRVASLRHVRVRYSLPNPPSEFGMALLSPVLSREVEMSR